MQTKQNFKESRKCKGCTKTSRNAKIGKKSKNAKNTNKAKNAKTAIIAKDAKLQRIQSLPNCE